MALVDFTYRLKPQSGDTTPHDELAVGADLSGGTITLVDLGSGEYAWHILGAASAVVASKTMNPAIAGGGYTFAVRVAITTWPATYADFAGLSEAKLQNASGTTVRAKVYNPGSYSTTGATASMGTTFHTYVLKYVTAVAAAADGPAVWVNKVGRSGSTPDLTSFGANANSVTINTVSIGSAGTAVDVTDFVVWGEELSDADCAALADTGIRATLDSAVATATTLSGPSSGTTGVASTNFTVGANGTITGTVTVTPGDAADGGTFTPTSVAISSGTPTATFTYTPASTGVKTISISDDGGLTDATSISYTSNAGGGSVRTPAFYQTFIAGR